MLASLGLYIAALPATILGKLGGAFLFVIPSWLNDGINTIFHGSGWLDTIFPIFPHPEMTGLVATIGIMTMFGWLLVLIGYAVLVLLVYWAIRFLVSVLPWSTHGVAAPHSLGK